MDSSRCTLVCPQVNKLFHSQLCLSDEKDFEGLPYQFNDSFGTSDKFLEGGANLGEDDEESPESIRTSLV